MNICDSDGYYYVYECVRVSVCMRNPTTLNLLQCGNLRREYYGTMSFLHNVLADASLMFALAKWFAYLCARVCVFECNMVQNMAAVLDVIMKGKHSAVIYIMTVDR